MTEANLTPPPCLGSSLHLRTSTLPPLLHHHMHVIDMPNDKYSVILPTYNERRNLPIIIWLLAKTFSEQYAPQQPREARADSVARSIGKSSLSMMLVQMERRTLPNSLPGSTERIISYVIPSTALMSATTTSSRQARTRVSGISWRSDRQLTSSTAYVHGLNFCTGTFAIIMDADFSHHVRLYSGHG